MDGAGTAATLAPGYREAPGAVARGTVAVPRLREWRIRRFLTQAQLAEAAGANPRTIARLEAGGTAELRTVLRLAQALGVEPEALTAPDPPG